MVWQLLLLVSSSLPLAKFWNDAKDLIVFNSYHCSFIRHKYLINFFVQSFLGTLVFRLVLVVQVGFQGVSILSFF